MAYDGKLRGVSVCEKAEDISHDFAKDPIQWVVDGDVLSTGGRTTLGADDGAGVALMMAVLEDNQLKHPAIEALFTTNEEEDMSGASGFDNEKMRSHYLINLDHTVDNQIMCGSCGGMQVDVRVPLELSDVPENWKTYRLSVSGLRGGHSGEDIHRGRGNANTLLARLHLVDEKVLYLSVSYSGRDPPGCGLSIPAAKSWCPFPLGIRDYGRIFPLFLLIFAPKPISKGYGADPKYLLPLFLMWWVVAFVFLAIAVQIGYGPF